MQEPRLQRDSNSHSLRSSVLAVNWKGNELSILENFSISIILKLYYIGPSLFYTTTATSDASPTLSKICPWRSHGNGESTSLRILPSWDMSLQNLIYTIGFWHYKLCVMLQKDTPYLIDMSMDHDRSKFGITNLVTDNGKMDFSYWRIPTLLSHSLLWLLLP